MTYKNFRSYFHTITDILQIAVKIAVFIDSVLPADSVP